MTEAQWRMLRAQSGSCIDRFSPFKKLLALGYIAQTRESFGHVTWRITESGRAALSERGGR